EPRSPCDVLRARGASLASKRCLSVLCAVCVDAVVHSCGARWCISAVAAAREVVCRATVPIIGKNQFMPGDNLPSDKIVVRNLMRVVGHETIPRPESLSAECRMSR